MPIVAAARDHLRRTFFPALTGARALTLAHVLYEEGRQIHGEDWMLERGETGGTPPLHDIHLEFNRRETAALCLSGGGIRSASFALGLLQCFASDPRGSAPGPRTPPSERLLTKFHYLSTVSGGGYIGSWLSAWLARAGQAGPTTQVVEDLGRLQTDAEPPQIANLRSNSAHLTPKFRTLSADMSTMARNLILNWAVWLPVLCVLVLAAKGYAAVEFALMQPSLGGGSGWLWGASIGALLAFIISLSYQSANRPSQGRSNRSQPWFVLCDLMPAVFAAALTALVLGNWDITRSLEGFARLFTDDGWWPVDILLALIGAFLFLLSWLLGHISWHRPKNEARGIGNIPLNWSPGYLFTEIADLLWWTLAGALFGFLVALATDALADHSRSRALLVVICGPPVVLLAQVVAQISFVGAVSLRQPDDDDREYLARAGGWYTAALLAWATFMTLVFLGQTLAELFGPRIATFAWDHSTDLLALVGGVSGAITLILGKRGSTARDSDYQKRDPKTLSLDLILAIAAPVFAATLIIAASVTLDQLLFGKPFAETVLFGGPFIRPNHWYDWPPVMLSVAFVVTVIVVAVVPWRININHFSLHALYRNRLIRAVLGASQTRKRQRQLDRPNRNLFTDMDPDDNLPMVRLWDRYSSQRGEQWRPFHVINIALNVVSARNPAWPERKAETFTVSPLYSGSIYDGTDTFHDTGDYGGKRGFGLSLGTAMAISGATASPNIGYHTSRAVTFLMTLFSARLGWWLANPGPTGSGFYSTAGPRWALDPLLSDLFGLRHEDQRYVYLTDGGHFENLGLYEMVRRRCRYIVVSDAGCDPEFTLEDLGNAIRKIQVDLGIRIEMRGIENLKKRDQGRQPANPEQRYYATGVIHYHEVDGTTSQDGRLLYIKPGLRWDESSDILSYALGHPDFPHESTVGDPFTEAQFESYRRLGLTVGSTILRDAGIDCQCTWKDVFDGLS